VDFKEQLFNSTSISIVSWEFEKHHGQEFIDPDLELKVLFRFQLYFYPGLN